jgi:hypothetical protein
MQHSLERAARGIAVAGTLACTAAAPLPAQAHQHGAAGAGMMSTPLGIPMDRMGSGTTWIPDAAPIASRHGRIGGWDFTGHGLVFAQYIEQAGPRGARQFGSLNWAMLMASHSLAGGMLQLRTMLSLDPAGVTARGYPMLLQTGETFQGLPLHDRQHPHDFWMELGALYLRPIASHAALELYLAPSGEPALGPVAFMHRPSAVDDPIAPLGHHWQDATHISFGVVTAGIFSHRWKLEGSLFNGREPDEHRWGIDLDRLDSYSGRLTYNSRGHWNATAGYGRLNLGTESVHRVAASLMHGARIGRAGQWASTLLYGANRPVGAGPWSHSLLLESEAVLDRSHTLFGRVEWVEKTAEDLVLPAGPRYHLAMASLGYLRELARGRGLALGVGIRGSIGYVPRSIESAYGSRTPVGGVVFLRLRPLRQEMADDMEGMPGMKTKP